MFSRVIAALFTLVLFTTDAAASQVSFRPLDVVVDEKTHVFVATVTAVKQKFADTETMRFYDLSGATSLRGSAPAGGTVLYTEIVPVMRDVDGAVVGYFSPILDASGEEPNVKAGTRYIFLSRGIVRDGSLLVFRVEPMNSEPKVRALLAKLPEAGAALAPEVKPAPSVTATPSAPPAPARQPARSGCALAFGVEDGGEQIVALVVSLVALWRRRRQPV